MVFESVALDKMWVFRSDGTTSVIRHPRSQDFDPPELDDPHTVYLFDTAGNAPREPLQVNAFTVVASSFLKRVRSKLYLPCWSLEDLTRVLEYFPHVTKEMLEARFLRFGGIPRYALPIQEDIDEQRSENELEIAIKSCDMQSILDSAGDIEVSSLPPRNSLFFFTIDCFISIFFLSFQSFTITDTSWSQSQAFAVCC